MLQKWIHNWEHKLSSADTNRTTLPFDWGLNYLNHGPIAASDPKKAVSIFNHEAVHNSDDFFQHTPLKHFHQEGDRLSFDSSIETPYSENNTVYCRVFRPAEKSDRAIVLLPQWNASAHSHVGLCRLLSRIGLTVLRLTLPYHEERNPLGPRADLMVSANIGRTIQAIQQSVVDARRAADWLTMQGFKKIGIMGSSVGSCISFLTYLHDQRFQAGVFNHVSSYFGDVVWEGISTRHVRRGFEGLLSREELHRAWAIISPNTHVGRKRVKDSGKRLFISARYDLTFPPGLAQLLFEEHHRHSVQFDAAFLPCGHYTSALAPFKYLVGYHVSRYFHLHLK
jgi:hypothetical protein